jgi:hypothetical protein
MFRHATLSNNFSTQNVREKKSWQDLCVPIFAAKKIPSLGARSYKRSGHQKKFFLLEVGSEPSFSFIFSTLYGSATVAPPEIANS